MPKRTTLALLLTLAVSIKAAAAINNSTAIKQAGTLANGGQAALRLGYDGDGCKGSCGDEPLASRALPANALKASLGHEFRPPMPPAIPAPESGAHRDDYSEYYGAPKEPVKSNNAGGPIGALVGTLVGGLGGLALAKFL